VQLAVMNFEFIGGSMGSVVGEKIARRGSARWNACEPLIIVSASGGARMMEGIFSLMQMAKTSAVLAQLHEAGLPYVSVLTDPTTGGVTASYAMLGDANLAEPGALIGFAGPRVIEQTIKQELPEGFQTAEFLLEHGMLDQIVDRRQMKRRSARLLRHMLARPAGTPRPRGTPADGVTLGDPRLALRSHDGGDPLGAGADARSFLPVWVIRTGISVRSTSAAPTARARWPRSAMRRCARAAAGGSGSTPRRTWSRFASGSGSTAGPLDEACSRRPPSGCARPSSVPVRPSSRRPPRSRSSASRSGVEWRWWRWGSAGAWTRPTWWSRWPARDHQRRRSTTPSTSATTPRGDRAEKAGIFKPGVPARPASPPARDLHSAIPIRVIPNLPHAVERAVTLAPYGTIVVTGSIHTVGDTMGHLGLDPFGE
jgi:hypothetical protein